MQFGYGYCEDFAAAVSVLLRGAGIEARYVPGLAYGSGRLMDHAWNLVKLNGIWYHLDTTLEDSAISNGMITYRYFLKGNDDMRATHVWGDALWNGDYLTNLQIEQARKFYDVEISDISYEQAAAEAYTEHERQNKEVLRDELNKEREQFIAEHGEIDPFRYDATAPVFGDMGYNRP